MPNHLNFGPSEPRSRQRPLSKKKRRQREVFDRLVEDTKHLKFAKAPAQVLVDSSQISMRTGFGHFSISFDALRLIDTGTT